MGLLALLLSYNIKIREWLNGKFQTQSKIEHTRKFVASNNSGKKKNYDFKFVYTNNTLDENNVDTTLRP